MATTRLRFCCFSAVEMRLQGLRSNEAAGLPINGVQRSGCEGRMQWDRQRPFARRQATSQLTMAAPSRDDLESESHEDRREGAA
jgi:hypothetical protein